MDPITAVWIWQRIVSPHVAGLADALAKHERVVYVAEDVMTDARKRQGWDAPALRNAEVRRARTAQDARDLVHRAEAGSVHICQGIRANGAVGAAQRYLAQRDLQQWIVMERVNDDGYIGAMRRAEYSRLLRRARRKVKGLLAIGERTDEWVVERGWNAERVYPFAYFIPAPADATVDRPPGRPFRIMFVGQLIRRKRLDLVIEALRRLSHRDWELTVIGGGPLEDSLRRRARLAVGHRVSWLGAMPMAAVQRQMALADCLVLPSLHDGWGVVASEALMVGTPVICSDRCGAAAAVRHSGQGGVFTSGDVEALAKSIGDEVSTGGRSGERRRNLKNWAECLGAEAGAAYLHRILQQAADGGPRPLPPWNSDRHPGAA